MTGLTFCEENDRDGSDKAAANALDADGEEAKCVGVVGDCAGADPTTAGRAGTDRR